MIYPAGIATAKLLPARCCEQPPDSSSGLLGSQTALSASTEPMPSQFAATQAFDSYAGQ